MVKMPKINVLHIVTTEELNGGKRYLLQLADNFPQHKYNLFFALTFRQDFINELEKRHIRYLVVNLKHQFNIKIFPALKKIIRDNNIQIVHTHGIRASFYGRLSAKWAGIPVILSTVHYSLYNYPVGRLRKRIYAFLDKVSSYSCDKLICVSNAVANDLIVKSRINARKIKVIYNGIELDRFSRHQDISSFKAKFGLLETQRIIAIVGRLTYAKGHRYLLEAIGRLVESFPDIRCLIVGDGPLREELKVYAQKLGIMQNCIFMGTRDDVAQILSMLDIFVLPSVSEGLPFVLLEAMAMQCAVVATNIGGINELVEDGRTGILVPPGDNQALAAALKELLQNRKKAQSLAACARLEVEQRFTLQRTLKETQEVYDECMNKKDKKISNERIN